MQYQPLFLMKIYSHFFKIIQPTPRVQNLIHIFCYKFTSRIFVKERGRWISKFDKVYVSRTADRSEYRFHINQLKEFKEYLAQNYINENFYTVETIPIPEPVIYDIPVRKGWEQRDYQVPIVDYLTEQNDNRSKFVGIQTGTGKTACALFSISRLGYRTLILIKPAYIDKWFEDILKVLDLKITDIIVVQGSDHLRGLFALAREGKLHSKFIILSNRTYQNYIKVFERDPESIEFLSYDCHPDEFYELLGVSLLLIDEVHQEFYSNYKSKLYAHIPVSMSLSATLINHDPFLEKMYEIAYPKKTRCDTLELKKYVKVYPVSYNFKEPKKIRTMEYGGKSYSHSAFEKSILYRPYVLKAYLDMIKWIVERGFIEDYKKGDKVLIFASSISMCNAILEYLKIAYPTFDVRRYVEEDPYENLMSAEMCVTTLLSGGTAHDVLNLRTVILTINIVSAQSNIQGMGRLRELSDRDVKFYYTYCEQLEKHVEYHEKRTELIKDRVASIKDTPYKHYI